MLLYFKCFSSTQQIISIHIPDADEENQKSKRNCWKTPHTKLEPRHSREHKDSSTKIEAKTKLTKPKLRKTQTVLITMWNNKDRNCIPPHKTNWRHTIVSQCIRNMIFFTKYMRGAKLHLRIWNKQLFRWTQSWHGTKEGDQRNSRIRVESTSR